MSLSLNMHLIFNTILPMHFNTIFPCKILYVKMCRFRAHLIAGRKISRLLAHKLDISTLQGTVDGSKAV